MSTEKKIGPAKGKTAAEALITGGAIAIALVLVNVLVSKSPARLDLTENKIYSLSDASKSLVRNMKERVNIRAYMGNVPAEQAEKAAYVDMLLSEYAESSGGRIDYQKIDPWDKPDVQEELKKDGIDKLRLQSRTDDGIQLVAMYFQVVFTHLDKKEVWTPEATFTLEGLEYDFSSRIKRLGYGKKKVAVTSGFGEPQDIRPLQMQGQEIAPGMLPGLKIGLADLYEVTPANWKSDPKSIDDADILIVNGPTEKISDAAKYHLDQRLMRGKAVLVLTNGMRWQSAGQQQQLQQMQDGNQPFVGMPNDNGLLDLLASYGFEVGKNVILDPRNSARYWLPVGGRQGIITVGFAPIVQVQAGDRHDILANMQAVALPFASTLKLVGPLAADKRDADTRVVELLKTMPTSFEHDELLAITQNLQPPSPKNGKGPYLVAAAVSTKLKSYYADHPIPADVNAGTPGASDVPGLPGMMPNDGEADPPPAAAPEPPTGPLKEGAAHTRLIVVTAPSLDATDTLINGQNAGEIVFLNNLVATHDVVDWLAEDEDLVAVRSKKVDRPLAKLESGERNVVKYLNIVGAPLLLVAFGIGYWRVREHRRKRYSL